MSTVDVLDMIGDARGTYIWDAQSFRTLEGKKPNRNMMKRFWITAAVISLLAVLAGCTVVYLLRMDDLSLGQKSIHPLHDNSPTETFCDVNLNALSLQGIRNSANHLANQEWFEFIQTYEPERKEYWESEEQYWSYSVLDQTMADKIDEICEKYGLNLIGKPWHEHQDCTEFLHLIGIESLQKPGSDAVVAMPQGRFFEGGSFTIYGNILLAGEAEPMYFTYQYVTKDVFYDVFAYVNPDIVMERTYTTTAGQNLLLLESGKKGMIMLDRADCFISLDISLTDDISLEKLAEHFNFSIHANALNPEDANLLEQASIAAVNAEDPFAGRFARNTYEEYIGDILWSDGYWKTQGGLTEEELPTRSYVLYDLDGNGEEELLMIHDGFIQSVVSKKDGITTEGKIYQMILCEDNVLIDITNLTAGETWYHIFYFANNDDPVFSNPKERSIVRLKVENGSWWRTSSTDHYADFDTKITEAEAMEILKSYTPVSLDAMPLEEFGEP